MEGKLIKTKVGYHLWLNPETKEQEHIASNYEIVNDNGVDLRKYKLSTKNCQAIENGYDLDELFDEVDRSIDFSEFCFTSFRLGFQKALEILGDKKFSEEELTMLFVYGHQIGMNDILAIQSQHSPQPMPKPDSDKLRDELIQSLQQTEWDVVIVTEVVPDLNSRTEVDGQVFSTNKKEVVKLDADGCLILK